MIIQTRKPAPIVVYVYNRPEHFKKCLDALAANPLAKQSELYVVSDGAARIEHQPAVDKVREIALSAKGFLKVHPMFRETNWGVYASATTADREVVENHGKIICLEDDILVAPSFLEFINSGLDFFEGDKRIYSVAGYCHPISFPTDYSAPYWLSLVHMPWGFGTWRDRYMSMDPSWNPLEAIKKNWRVYGKMFRYCTWISLLLEADARGQVVAGDARVIGQMLLKGQLSVVPRVSRAKNIGLDGSGLHCGLNPEGDGVTLVNNLDEVLFSSNLDVDYRIVKTLNSRICSPSVRIKAVMEALGVMNIAQRTKRNLKLIRR